MPLIEELEQNGRWLFRWRSYLPLGYLVLILASLRYFTYPYGSETLDCVWECVCLAVGFGGLAVRGAVAGYAPRRTSGRNTKEQVADTLNTAGMYSVVRNPLYLGNFLMGLAGALFLREWWVPLIYFFSFALYYERIVFAEEAFLRRQFGEAYVAWASRTPAFLPRLSGWRRPALPFSWRTCVRREYQSAFILVASLFALEEATDLYLNHAWELDAMWAWIMGVATAAYIVTRILHQHTGLLKVQGR